MTMRRPHTTHRRSWAYIQASVDAICTHFFRNRLNKIFRNKLNKIRLKYITNMSHILDN
jgi:hypothetical protein